MDIEDFSKQFLVPAMQAFQDKIDSYLLGLQSDIEGNRVPATGNIRDDVVDVRAKLTAAAAPLADRRFVYNSDTEADLLKTDLFVSAEKVGDEGTALREASLGRKFGMDFYVDQNADTLAIDAMAFHKNAFALVTRPLALPEGAAKAEIVNYDGFGLRVVFGYDMNKKKDTISIDMLCGVKTLDADLAAVLEDVEAAGYGLPRQYTEEALNSMTINDIKALAEELGYTITQTVKVDIIAEFLAQQDAQ